MSLSLSKIIGTLVREFERASLSVDLSREQLREAYADHLVLNEIVPSRIRIAEANISLPLAIDEIKSSRNESTEISRRQIKNLALSEIPLDIDKNELANLIYNKLKATNNALLTNRNLKDHIEKAGKAIIKDFKLTEVNIQNIKILQQSFQDKSESEAKFIYQTELLEKISSEKIFKLEFKIVVD